MDGEPAYLSIGMISAATTQPAVAALTSTARLSKQDHERLRREHARRKTLTAYFFLLPCAIFFVAFLIVPILYLLYLTFHTGGIITPARFVGLENWQRAWNDELVRTAIRNTLYYCLLAIPAVFVIAMVLALCLQRIPRGSGPFRSLFYLPTLTPYVTAALIWLFVVQRDFGALNLMLGAVGLPPQNWLGNPTLVMPSIAMLEVWRGVGFWTLLFLAALLALPPELYQAATVDGANGWQQLRHITLPLMQGNRI